MSLVVFLILSVILIGSLYYFMFIAPAKNANNAQDQAPDPKAAEDPKVLNQRGAANRLRNRRATNNADSDDSGGEEEKKFENWAERNAGNE